MTKSLCYGRGADNFKVCFDVKMAKKYLMMAMEMKMKAKKSDLLTWNLLKLYLKENVYTLNWPKKKAMGVMLKNIACYSSPRSFLWFLIV